MFGKNFTRPNDLERTHIIWKFNFMRCRADADHVAVTRVINSCQLSYTSSGGFLSFPGSASARVRVRFQRPVTSTSGSWRKADGTRQPNQYQRCQRATFLTFDRSTSPTWA